MVAGPSPISSTTRANLVGRGKAKTETRDCSVLTTVNAGPDHGTPAPWGRYADLGCGRLSAHLPL